MYIELLKKYSFIILTLGVWILGIIPKQDLPQIAEYRQNFSVDSVGHIVLYFCLFSLTFEGLGYWTKLDKRSYILSTLLLTSFSAIGIELYQKFFTNRSFEFTDIIAALIGAIIGLVYFYFIVIRKSR